MKNNHSRFLVKKSYLRTVSLAFLSIAFTNVFIGHLIASGDSKAPTLRGLSNQRNGLSLEERTKYQRAIEQVYLRHQIWPKENLQPKPTLDESMPYPKLRTKVEDYLRKSHALEVYWHRSITREQLQTEIARMASQTRMPLLLNELWEALDNDAYVIAECLARPLLVDKLMRESFSLQKPKRLDKVDDTYSRMTFDQWWKEIKEQLTAAEESERAAYTLPNINHSASTSDDTWEPTGASVAEERSNHTAVWTGSEMIVWGGFHSGGFARVGGRYNSDTDSWTPTNWLQAETVGKPRYKHTTIWTGTEMIVWGGSDGNILNSGARYNPITDNWTSISSVSAPSPRTDAKAIWTGTEMIVWGGYFNLNTGGKYNPSTDQWVATTTVNAPEGRSGHTLIWTGSEMIVWGGENISSLKSGGKYDPVSDTWLPTQLLNAPSARAGHTAVWTGSAMIVWAGTDDNSGGRYDPLTNSWVPTSLSSAPSVRSGHTAIWTGSEMIVWGGSSSNVFMNTGGRYNPLTDSWNATNTSNAPGPRSGHTAIWTGTLMIIWGGNDGSDLNTGSRYNPATDEWIATSTTVVPKISSQTAVWTGNEMILWGQSLDSGNTIGIKYNPAVEAWISISMINAPTASGSSTVWTGTEMIVWGGGNLNTGRRYNPATDSWTAMSIANAPEGRFVHSAVWTGSQMVIWGGSLGGVPYVNTGGRYNPTTDAWSPMTTLNAPTGRYSHTAVWANGEMIIWGGVNTDSFLNTGGRYNPSTDSWTPTATMNVPNARASHSAIWSGSEMIIWGGADANFGTPFNSGGKYNPTTDSWTSVVGGPSGRTGHTAVWTGSEMIIYGGSVSTPSVHCINYLRDGARYEPISQTWRNINQTGMPSARSGHTAIWTGSEMIVWGGLGPSVSCFNIGLDTGGRYRAEYVPADITISNSVIPNSAQAGSTVAYTITISNIGPNTASSVQVTDNLPPTLSFVSCSSTDGGVCGGVGNNRTVTFSTLAVNTTATITILAKVACSVPNGSVVTNTDTVNSATQDPNLTNNSASTQITVMNSPPSITPSDTTVSANGGNGNVSVQLLSGCSWMAISNDNWITITSGSNGTGNGMISYSVAANSTTSPRAGTITIAGLTFTVTQEGLMCSYSIFPTNRTHGPGNESEVVSVTAFSVCNWTANSNANWLFITSGVSGTGNGTVFYSVQANSKTTSRTGTLTIGGQAFTVTQSGKCTPFDLDGDKRTDISIFRPSNGTWYTIASSTSSNIVTGWGINGDAPVPGDYDGDGKTDVAVWRASTGDWYIIHSSDGTIQHLGWGVSGDVPVPGDYDGDGKTDVAVWRPSTGVWYIINSRDGSLTTRSWGVSTDIPVVGDYDGDGESDIAQWRSADGGWFIINSHDGSITVQSWGINGDKPVPGDYDGDGKTDLAIWRPSNGVWFIVNSSNSAIKAQGWGITGDKVVPGDYDGDSKTDIAIWRSSTGVWFIINSSDSSVKTKGWGINGDQPVPSAFVR